MLGEISPVEKTEIDLALDEDPSRSIHLFEAILRTSRESTITLGESETTQSSWM
jgi:hypothetical protein